MADKKLKVAPEYDIVYGVHSITTLVTAKKRKLYQLYTTNPEPKALSTLRSLLPSYCTIHHVTKAELTRRAGSEDHQSLVGYAGPLPVAKQPFNPKQQPIIALLDSVQDSRNIGAIIRSAYCTGLDGIVLPHKNAGELNGATHKASAGMLEYMPIYRSATSKIALQEIQKAGYTIVLAALGGTNAQQFTFKTPLCIVIGNEGTGISSELMSYGTAVTLPQRTKEISYNASVAAGILFFLVSAQIGQLTK